MNIKNISRNMPSVTINGQQKTGEKIYNSLPISTTGKLRRMIYKNVKLKPNVQSVSPGPKIIIGDGTVLEDGCGSWETEVGSWKTEVGKLKLPAQTAR